MNVFHRLIAKAELHETTHEVKNLELLKLRFGETSLHHCEIMLRDVEDSKRLNKRVPDDFLQATVVSQVFWPSLPDDELTVHPSVQSHTQLKYMNIINININQIGEWVSCLNLFPRCTTP